MSWLQTLTLSLCIVLISGVSFALAWTGPTQTPPNGNVSAPINIGTTAQVKNGGLSVNSLAVFGNTIISGVSRYLNFGTTAGATGYGIRDNAGVMEVKSSGGSWLGLLSGSGTTNYLPKLTAARTIGTSQIFDNGTNVGVGTTSPAQKFSVAGQIYSALGGFRFPDGTVQTTAASSNAGTYQVFNTSGTWTKPASGTFATIECWGGGGGAGPGSSAGGGGGGYNTRTVALSTLPSSVTVTIGTGGAGVSAGNGGNSGFGTYVYAYGGGGAGANGRGAIGGGGGGPLSAGEKNTGMSGKPKVLSFMAQDWDYSSGSDSNITSSVTYPCYQGSGEQTCPSGDGVYHGGGGGSPYSTGVGGSSVYGGGGGAGNTGYSTAVGGMSQHGGKGGNRGESGVQPGGGGGAPNGAGAAGRCAVMTW